MHYMNVSLMNHYHISCCLSHMSIWLYLVQQRSCSLDSSVVSQIACFLILDFALSSYTVQVLGSEKGRRRVSLDCQRCPCIGWSDYQQKIPQSVYNPKKGQKGCGMFCSFVGLLKINNIHWPIHFLYVFYIKYTHFT